MGISADWDRFLEIEASQIEKVEDLEPIGCEKKFNEDLCIGCEFRFCKLVSHPGGSTYHSVDRFWCDLGYWEDSF